MPGQVLMAQRAFTVEDVLREESIAQAKLSPDGRWLAYKRDEGVVADRRRRTHHWTDAR